MERWSVAVNSVYKTGHVYRQVGPWYIFFIEWLSSWVCDIFHRLPSVPLPKWTICNDCFLGDDLLDPGETSTLKEWYGDIAGLVHSRIDDPIFQWCHKRYVETQMDADIDDLAVFADWINKEEEEEEEEQDPWYQQPKFKELEDVRQQIFDLRKKRESLTNEIVATVKNRKK